MISNNQIGVAISPAVGKLCSRPLQWTNAAESCYLRHELLKKNLRNGLKYELYTVRILLNLLDYLSKGGSKENRY